ncbi:MAG TPA: trigger factor [Casimicrobiaceae bacterium]|nr:trigger factor [Casimicrobiaceae bacterium]
MQTHLENLSELERRLTMAVPLQDIEGEVKKRLTRLAKTVKLAGFRPGHVPMKLIAQQYGPQVRSDVISDAVQKSFSDAVRENNLRVAGYPRIEPRSTAEAPGALEFSALFEIYPEVTVGDVSSATIERPRVEVTAADVDRTLDVLRKQRATWSSATQPAAEGDRVIVDFTGTIDGAEFPGGQAKDFPIQLGEGRMLPEFESALIGVDAGQSKTFSLTFPADYHGKEVAGKTAQFTLHVKDVSTPRLAPLDDAFAKTFGIASGRLDDLRSEVASNLRLELKRKIESVEKEQVFAALRSQARFALPKAMIDIEAQAAMERMARDLREQGMKSEDIKLTPDMFREQATERVKLGLVVGELVRSQSLAARPEQVKALVSEAAQTYEQPEAVVRWHYDKPERLNEFEALAVERNILDWVLARAKVVDRPMAFEALMGPGRS